MVIPQMVVGVAGLATDGQFCFSTHTMRAFCWRARTRRGMKTKRPSFTSRRHQVFRENTLIEEPPRVPPHLPGTFVPARAPLPSHQGQEAGSRACAQTAPDADSQITVRILVLSLEQSTPNCVIKRPNHWLLWVRTLQVRIPSQMTSFAPSPPAMRRADHEAPLEVSFRPLRFEQLSTGRRIGLLHPERSIPGLRVQQRTPNLQ